MAPVMRVGLSRPDPSSMTAGMAGVAFVSSRSTHSAHAAAAGMDSVHTTCTNSTKNGTNNRKKRTAPKEEQAIYSSHMKCWRRARRRWDGVCPAMVLGGDGPETDWRQCADAERPRRDGHADAAMGMGMAGRRRGRLAGRGGATTGMAVPEHGEAGDATRERGGRQASRGGALPWRWCPIQSTNRVHPGLLLDAIRRTPPRLKSASGNLPLPRNCLYRVNTSKVGSEFVGERSADFAGGRRSSTEHSNATCFGYMRVVVKDMQKPGLAAL
ncbi:hypothetical protein ZWY2020_042543 [Hordeum vulgare]|nr:hypothetical protein ZWY2020_042543 [Hordeum vulgare]